MRILGVKDGIVHRIFTDRRTPAVVEYKYMAMLGGIEDVYQQTEPAL